jgi:hypothetical protein
MTRQERTVTQALIEVLLLGDVDDHSSGPDGPAGRLQRVAAALGRLEADDREDLADMITQCAETETEPARRQAALRLPEALRLT